MSATLTLIRGLPGSGKSTLAKQLSEQAGSIHLETDMYFVDQQGRYRFQPRLLSKAHQWCQVQTRSQLQQGKSVIVSNTFVRHWEMQAYIEMAQELGVKLEIKICSGEFGSIHDIEPSVIDRMRANWQN